MNKQLTSAELEAYLDEDLSPKEMSEVEKALRDNPKMLQVIANLISRRDAGMHSLGAMWRRHRLSCPSREQLGSYLLGVAGDDFAAYVKFHVHRVGCRICNANLEDLQRQQQEETNVVDGRRRRYFQSSAGYLRGGEK